MNDMLLPLTLLLAAVQSIAAQNFSNWHHDCAGWWMTGASTVLVGHNCAPYDGGPENHDSELNLDLCLGFDLDSFETGTGGGYTKKCKDCSVPPEQYSCSCWDFGVSSRPVIDLSTFVGVVNGTLCCNAGTEDQPAVRCGDYYTY